jgi:hypothetical protein
MKKKSVKAVEIILATLFLAVGKGLKIPRGLPCTSSILVLGTSKIRGFSDYGLKPLICFWSEVDIY